MACLTGVFCSQSIQLRAATLLCVLLITAGPLWAQAPPVAEKFWPGRTLSDALDELHDAGVPIVYSTNLVTPALKVTRQPTRSDPLGLLLQVLEPHGLEVQQLGGMYLVVRAAKKPVIPSNTGMLMIIISGSGEGGKPERVTITARPKLPHEEVLAGGVHQYDQVPAGNYRMEIKAAGFRTVQREIVLHSNQTEVLQIQMEPGPLELEGISVSASRYVLFSNSQFFIDQRAIQNLPDLGEDPVRSAHHLPGAAAGGLSSSTHFRGGELNETSIYLNGLELIDPFHIRNYNNIFSTIDARAISGVEAYTGGFPANYGDSTSGVLLFNSQRPDKPHHTELGLSVYNTSALFSGYSARGNADWLLSARRSNLNESLPDDLGNPSYYDVFSQLGVDLNDRTRLSFNSLYAHDQVVVITEPDSLELEQSDSNTRNLYLWMVLENQWNAGLSSTTVLSSSHVRSLREAQVNDPDQYTGTVTDRRNIDVLGLRQDWLFESVPDHELRWGFEVKRQKASYRYSSEATYVDFFDSFLGKDNPAYSQVSANPSGNSYAVFLSDRWNITRTTALQPGMRWDRQTYTRPNFSDQLSPRISLLHQFNEMLELRLSWGRYYQSQPIQQLQVEDGQDRFFPSQRADHWIAGLQYRFDGGYRLRLEAYDKDYSRLKPRFENLFDALALIPELEPDRIRLDPKSARSRGLELSLEYRGERGVNWWLSASWAKATDSINGRDRTALLGSALYATRRYRLGARADMNLGAAFNLHTGWPTTELTLGFDEAQDRYFPIAARRNASHLNRFATLDFRISRSFQVKIGQLSAFLEVTNATDHRNVCCLDYDLDEDSRGNPFLDRSEDTWLPVIPAAGILWEF